MTVAICWYINYYQRIIANQNNYTVVLEMITNASGDHNYRIILLSNNYLYNYNLH